MARTKQPKTPRKISGKASKPRPRQTLIADDIEIRALDKAMNVYQRFKNDRIDMLANEIEAKAEVKRLMIENNMETYRSLAYDLVAKRIPGEEEVKVSRPKQPKAEANGETTV